jgi:predicted patatin/cPLA2 family phospholipase
MIWLYNNEPVEEIDEKYAGFVYLITNLSTGKRYIGKKLSKFSKTSTKTVTLKSGIKKKKKIRSKVDSDWKTYWSSSKDVQADVKTLGEDKFKREILMFCLTKGTATYYEDKYQFQHEVLENPDKWYNGQIQCRIHRSHIKIEN